MIQNGLFGCSWKWISTAVCAGSTAVVFITYRPAYPGQSRLPVAQVFDVVNGGVRIETAENVLAGTLAASAV